MTKSNLEENGYFLANNIEINSERAKSYFSRRKYLITLIKTIHSNISYNSQSFFLSIFLMDIIFLKENLNSEFYSFFPSKIPSKEIKLNNYILLSLGCLIIAYKFNGSNSMLYPLNNIIKIIYYISGEKFGFSKKDLAIGEACIIKLLKYKLNFYTIYHYLTFFFSHGIIFKKNLAKYKLIEKKVLEKIYIQSRQLLDYIIEQNKYFELFNGKLNYITACQIIQWASEKVLNIKIKSNDNIFKVIYNINITESTQKKFLEIIGEKNKEKKIIKTKTNMNMASNIFKTNNQFIYNSPQNQIPKNNIYSNINSEYSYASQTNVDNNLNNSNIFSIKSKNLEENDNTNNGNINHEKKPLDSIRKKDKVKQKINCQIIPMKKDIKKHNTEKSFSLIKTEDSISFTFDSLNEDYKSPSNNYRIHNFNNEIKPNSKEIVNKSKILKKMSNEYNNSKEKLNSSYIFYKNTYNTTNSFSNNNKANIELENSKVHKAKWDEPKDNCSKNRRIKSKIIKRKINNNSKSINQSNTIIINNNMQINTFISHDNNNYKSNQSSNASELYNLTDIEKVNIQPQIINIVLNGKK